jgi:hypothetical protein
VLRRWGNPISWSRSKPPRSSTESGASDTTVGPPGPAGLIVSDSGHSLGQWAAASNVEIAYTPTNSSWLNRIEAQFTALRYLTLDGTDHASHREQGSMIRRYLAWRNRHTSDPGLRRVVNRAIVA